MEQGAVRCTSVRAAPRTGARRSLRAALAFGAALTGLAAGSGWSSATASGRRSPDGSAAAAPATAAAPAPDLSWQELSHAAKLAHDAQDYAVYRADAARLFELLSGHPDTVFAMARAEALLGHAATALEWLNAYAGMGLIRDVAGEPDLASLRQLPGFAAVQARFEANRRPVAHGLPAFTLTERELLAEDLAFDPATHRFFVSSIRQAKIVAIDARTGAAVDFVPAGRDGIWGVLALAVDARRGILWATTAAMPQTRGYRSADAGHSAVLRYDLATGALRQRFDLPLPPATRPAPVGGPAGAPAGQVPVPDDERQRVLGDMTVAPGGDVYVSEAVTGAVYTIRPGRDELEALEPPGTFISPQTPAATPDGKRLLVADYVHGIAIVELASRAVTWMAHPRDSAVNGIDGMYLAGDSLIAVQNGVQPNRLVRYRLDPALTRVLSWEPLDSNSPGLGAPTHGTVVGRDFYYLANSGWDQLADDGTVKPGGALTPAQVRRVAL